jgi:hypothetical protein
MSRMRTLVAAAAIATLAVLIPAAAQASPDNSGSRGAAHFTYYWGG